MKKIIYLAISLTFLNSCRGLYHYFPSYQSVPIFHKKNDLQIDCSAGNVQEIAGTSIYGSLTSKVIRPWCFDTHVSYSLTDYLYLNFLTSYDYNYYYSESETLNPKFYYKVSYLTSGLGIGYYKWFSNCITGIATNVSFGKTELFDNYDIYSSYPTKANLPVKSFNANNLIFAISPFLGYEYEFSQVALQLNCSNFQYSNIRNRLGGIDSNDNNFLDLLKPINESFQEWFVEPSITFKTGTKQAKFVFQETRSYHFGKTNLNYMSNNSYIGIELNFDIDNWFKKENK